MPTGPVPQGERKVRRVVPTGGQSGGSLLTVLFCNPFICRQAQELKEAREELERFKELLVTYEQSIGRKDHIVSNLTRAMQKQVGTEVALIRGSGCPSYRGHPYKRVLIRVSTAGWHR